MNEPKFLQEFNHKIDHDESDSIHENVGGITDIVLGE